MTKRRWETLLVAAALAATAGACGGSKKSNSTPTPTPTPTNTGSVNGSLVEAGSLTTSGGVVTGSTAVPSVSVRVAGTEVVRSNEQGFFSGEFAPGDPLSVCFEAAGFVTRCRNVRVVAGAATTLPPVELMREGAPDLLPAGIGTAENRSATVTLAAGTICKLDRTTPVAGDIRCSVTPIDAGIAEERRLAPGDYSGVETGGRVVQLATGGMLDVRCTAAATGERVNVCNGKSAQVKIPITAACDNAALYPNPMKSWSFDEATGRWKEEASFNKVCAGATGYYEGSATHFSYWNADFVLETTCLSGKAVDASNRGIRNVLVKCEGVDYQGSSEAYSGADGSFCVPVKSGGQYSCVAAKGSFRMAVPKTGTAPATVASCGGTSTCGDLGNLMIADPLARAILTWGEKPSDLDSHFVGPNVHISYQDQGLPGAAPFIWLDTDDTTSFGPEIVSVMPGAAAATYRYCVNDYSRDTVTAISASGAKVVLSVGATQKTYAVPQGTGNVWQVFQAVVAADGTVTTSDLNRIVNAATNSATDVANACKQ